MKKITACIIVLCLCLSLSVSALASGLTAIRDYDNSGFTDVPEDWSRPYITACYELGLMSGQGEGRFAPGGSVTVAEGITVAARVHDLWLGGEGEIPGGDPWYAGAVDYALEYGLMTQGEFPNYTATATRAQLAGLLARALPEEDYAAINNITALPDVTGATPYSGSILKLYNAGVLTGSDQYGTFSPSSYITRAELAAILCRLVQPDTRVELTLAEKPADLTVRTSSRKLYVSGVPVMGLVEINGQFYIPGEVLDDEYYATQGSFSEKEDYYELSFRTRYFQGEIATLNFWSVPPEGQVLGTASPSAKYLWKGGYVAGTVYTLDGRYPMISLDALGATTDGVNFYLDVGADAAKYTLVPEDDVTGGRVTPLIRSTPRETVIAIHDYIVNTLTYNIFYQAPRGTTQAEYEAAEAAYNAAYETYKLGNNITLVAGYGVCADYAELFRTMCIRAGIPCIVVKGSGKGESHAWNMVYVDGQWLYVDCTWDDPISRTPTLEHDYLLIDADRLANTHYWTGDDYPLPKEYDPAWEQLDPNNITSTDMFRKCLVAQLMQHKTSITLRVTKSGAYGGTGCIYAYPAGWWTFYGGYNSSTGTYQYTVEY